MDTKRLSRRLASAPVGGFLLLLCAGCGGVDDGSPEADGASGSSQDQTLLGRSRHSGRDQQPSTGSSASGSTATNAGSGASTDGTAASGTASSGTTSGGTAGSSTASSGTAGSGNPSWSIDPVTGVIIVHGVDPNVDPNSGVNYDDLNSASVDSGGSCPGNAAMSGACAHYGVQCTFDDAGVTRYCTCLASGSSGTQAWECR